MCFSMIGSAVVADGFVIDDATVAISSALSSLKLQHNGVVNALCGHGAYLITPIPSQCGRKFLGNEVVSITLLESLRFAIEQGIRSARPELVDCDVEPTNAHESVAFLGQVVCDIRRELGMPTERIEEFLIRHESDEHAPEAHRHPPPS